MTSLIDAESTASAATQETLYVATTRGRHSCTIYTDGLFELEAAFSRSSDRLRRLYIKACDTNRAECPYWADSFEKWTKLHYSTFHPAESLTSSPWDISPRVNLAPPDVSFREIDQFIRSGQFTALQAKAEGWIHQHSSIKAIHFCPIDTPFQGWEHFHRFCRAFDYLDKPRKDSLCYYFLIQLPSR